jgi:hypothetical protein
LSQHLAVRITEYIDTIISDHMLSIAFPLFQVIILQ